MDKHPEALALGYKNAVWKTAKIKELGIHPDMDEEAKNSLIKELSEAKAVRDGGDWKTYVKGQDYYVSDLIKFSGLDAQERLDHEYSRAFPDVAGEDEMIISLNALI